MNILKLSDFSVREINEILDCAKDFKDGRLDVNYDHHKIIANLFFEPSTRTHYSFSTAALKLGCDTLEFNAENSSLKKGETLYDTVKTFEMFGVDALVIRATQNAYYDDLKSIKIPILNAGDGTGNHPSQSLLDLFTIREEFGKFEGLKIAIVGDIKHSRVAHSNIDVMKRLGMDVYIAGPKEYQEDEYKVANLDDDIDKFDIIMLLRVQNERHDKALELSNEEYNALYGLNIDRVKKMKDKAIIMHPAPFNRGVEITDDVVECSKSRIFKQIENGVYVRMALIYKVLER